MLVAEQVLGVERDGPRYGHAFLHTSRNLAGEFLLGIYEVHPVEALTCALLAVAVGHVGEHVEGKHHILQNRQRVEERRALENHSHLTTQRDALVLVHYHQVASVVEHLSAGRVKQSYEVLHQHGLSRPALPDNQVGLSILEDSIDVFQHILVFERFVEMLYFYHGYERSWVRNTSENRMSTLLDTTAEVLASPTSTEPPFTE